MFESLRSAVDLRATADEKYARLRDLVNNLGIKVTLDAGFSSEASYDGHTIRIMHPDYLEKEYGMSARGAEEASIFLLTHELAHVMFSPPVQRWLGAMNRKYTALGYNWDKMFGCLDAVEDVIVDTKMSIKYRGVKEYQVLGRKNLYKHLLDDGKQNPRDNTLLAAFMDVQAGVKGTLRPEQEAKYNVVANELQAAKKAATIPGTTDGEEYAVRIYEAVWGKPDPTAGTPEQGQGQSQKQKGEKGDASNNKGSQSGGTQTEDADDNGDADDGSDTGDTGDTEDSDAGEDDEPGDKGDVGNDADADSSDGGTDEGDGTGESDGDSGTEKETGSSEPDSPESGTKSRNNKSDKLNKTPDREDKGKAEYNDGKPIRLDMTKAYNDCGKKYNDSTPDANFNTDIFGNGNNCTAYQHARSIHGAKTIYNRLVKEVEDGVDLKVGYVETKGNRCINKYYPTDEVRAKAMELTRRLKTIMQNETMAYSNRHNSGRFDTNALTRLAANDPTVFKQKDTKTEGGVAVTLLLDASGSMGCNTIAVGRMAYIISTALVNNGIPVKVMSHTTQGRIAGGCTMLCCHKDWDEKTPDGLSAYRSTGANRDPAAVFLAGTELMLRPEEKKLLVVLSDGQPADGASSSYSMGRPVYIDGRDGVLRTKRVINGLRASGVRTVGIYWETNDALHMLKDAIDDGETNEYINDNVFKQMYGNDFMVCNSKEWEGFPAKLTRALTNLFNR